MGRKKRPIWAVVAADGRAPRDGRFIEDLGRYYPLEEPARVELKDERILHWLSVGAQPTETVRSLLSRQGILLHRHLERNGAEADAITEAVAAHQAHRIDKAQSGTKLTAAMRKEQAMEAETRVAEKREQAALEELRRKRAAAAEAKARKAAEAEARAAAEAEAGEAAETEA